MESSPLVRDAEKRSDPASPPENDSPVFSLDIGTRSVVGLIGYQREDHFEICDYEQVFHKVHAMRDGQIEDIELVASAVRQVKTALETRCGVSLKKTAIAAAGRTLKTVHAAYSQELDENEEISASLVHSLEYAVVSQAQQNFIEENPESGSEDFFCVGYSITSYVLDGYTYSNLEGHRGRSVKLDAIAAFLPRHVVSCLYAVTERNDLAVENLTLEPIAAINVIVPRDIRLLNIVIVDIGAGTSDIAISRNGSIAAYGMVTVAGDEITEIIMRTLLTDFDTAERIKISWANGADEIGFSDILGLARTVSTEEVERICSPVIEVLCKTISEAIMTINGGAPMAVFLVGGGSATPSLCSRIAQGLEMPEERVAVGGRTLFKNISLCSDKLQSPEFVTPIGIGVVCSLYKGCNFFSILVNGRNVMLLDQGSIQVMDALLLAGIKPAKLIGLSSSGLSYTLNGEKITERGNPGTQGALSVNGAEATIHTLIRQGDVITASPAENGAPVSISIADILSRFSPLHVSLDSETVSILPSATVNGRAAENGYIIKDGDSVEVALPSTLRELLMHAKKPVSGLSYTVNGSPVEEGFPVSTGDVIRSIRRTAAPPPEERPFDSSIKVCINGDWRVINYHEDEPLLFVDMLNYTDIDPQNPQGNLTLLINGRPAGYIDPVSTGDVIEIRWEKSLL